MARKTKEDAQATREAILDAAEACFREKGLSRTGLEAIAAGAGVTRGAVYWHFRNKDEVLDAVVNRVSVPFFHGLDRVSRPEGTTPLRDLRETLRQSLHDLVHDRRVRTVLEVIELRSEIVGDDDIVGRIRQSGMQSTQSRIEAAFRHAAALGQLRDGLDPASCALRLHFIIGGAVRIHLLAPQQVRLERDGMAAIDLALRAMARDPALLDAAT